MKLLSQAQLGWTEYCDQCNSDCCYKNDLFLSDLDKVLIGTVKIDLVGEEQACQFLDEQSGCCNCYLRRPLDCRLFPFNLEKRENGYMWVMSAECPAHGFLDPLASVDELEDMIRKTIFGIEMIQQFVAHYKNNPVLRGTHWIDVRYANVI